MRDSSRHGIAVSCGKKNLPRGLLNTRQAAAKGRCGDSSHVTGWRSRWHLSLRRRNDASHMTTRAFCAIGIEVYVTSWARGASPRRSCGSDVRSSFPGPGRAIVTVIYHASGLERMTSDINLLRSNCGQRHAYLI
jgi:hypothetical protein